ncbi:hypothetical protein VB780_26220 [Leptolyngbya sp. CCNP1308]|uniref:hypothetical protein n=1 Tax=Leptolyngbya sp. CCNP1308 TaxID=3110255 RepID=UPI002B1F915C|nr:hypothetical protein [Leptolyngbya sp. CCNP1308]MEA5452098.1 hypothetical protein [Leptolyngbya sp. CCNP1308]
MSTKATIAYGQTFHFYHEALDDNYVYLELEQVQFEASYNRVTVPIPVHIWEVIRQYPGIDLSWADKSDAEILDHVSQCVDERIRDYETAEPDKKGWVSFFGGMVFGNADDPRNAQIEQGVAHYQRRRQHQQQVKAAIAELQQAQRNPA